MGSKIVGGADPLICLPLMAENFRELKEDARKLISLAPDLIEWRLDYYGEYKDTQKMTHALTTLNEMIGATPLLLTCRSVNEGGHCQLSADQRRRLNLAAISHGGVEFLDVEIHNGIDVILPIKTACEKEGVNLLLSYHNFNETPPQDVLVSQLVKAQDLGAHLAKIAVMPRSPGDVLTLLQAAYTARTQIVEIPIIAISMGSMGVISRIAGGDFGSDIIFAAGEKSSAPGQVPITDLRLHWELMKP